jgi:hypothetical protein
MEESCNGLNTVSDKEKRNKITIIIIISVCRLTNQCNKDAVIGSLMHVVSIPVRGIIFSVPR